MFQNRQLRDLFNSGVNNNFQQTQMDQTPGITLDCPYKGRNEDPQPLKIFIICEASIQGETNVTSPMQLPLFGMLMLHSALESHFYCTVTSAKHVH